MIYIDLNLTNPWSKTNGSFKPLTSFVKPITKNKTFELESYISSDKIFEFRFEYTPRQRDHGGLILSFGIFSMIINLSLRDNRHWDTFTDNWCSYENL